MFPGYAEERSKAMNIFGMIFSFTFPGVLIGIMAGIALAQHEQKAARRRREAKNGQKPQRGLYIASMKEEAQHEA